MLKILVIQYYYLCKYLNYHFHLYSVNKIEFLHIENPLIHKGLDDNETFIRKTEEGTRNLYLLYKTGRVLMSGTTHVHVW